MNPEPSHPLTLPELGWTAEHAAAFAKYTGPYIAGRVVCRQKTVWDILTEEGPLTTGISGALRKLSRYPAVGDFVVLFRQPSAGTTVIVDILPQKTRFTRGSPGQEGSDQVIAANVDTVFIVTAAGHDLSARRTERYLAIAHASGARPVILINKADLAGDSALLADELVAVAAGIPVIPVSATSGEGLDRLGPFLAPGTTAVLIGSSGVGKSTLINRLLDGHVQDTSLVRDFDGKGRHTTTVRELFVLNNGALVIDSPGIREVGIGTASAGMAETFPEIQRLAEGCRFADCRHEREPGCAVLAAVERGELDPSRLENYRSLVKELAFGEKKADLGLVRLEREKMKGIGKMARDIQKTKKEIRE
ncbi:ribosome small subunit-dependent GTPase A, partial [Methanoregula sp.]|uniref:ribosome small subunit-dependent GTPase A n=1 Tax=Methanoregula sp. TaxID=2052170 RepID=UPI000CBC170B